MKGLIQKLLIIIIIVTLMVGCQTLNTHEIIEDVTGVIVVTTAITIFITVISAFVFIDAEPFTVEILEEIRR